MAWKKKHKSKRSTPLTKDPEHWVKLRELRWGLKIGTLEVHTIPVDLQYLLTNDGYYELACSECEHFDTEAANLEWPVHMYIMGDEEEAEETDAWPAISHAGTEYPISFQDIIQHTKKHPDLMIHLLVDLSKTTWKVLNWTGPQVKQLLGLE